jgi:hypothetical protein
MPRKYREESSIEDYAHWNEEAAIVKSREDRYSDYYYEEDDGQEW